MELCDKQDGCNSKNSKEKRKGIYSREKSCIPREK